MKKKGKSKSQGAAPIKLSEVQDLVARFKGKKIATWSELTGDSLIRSNKYNDLVKCAKKLYASKGVNRLAIAALALKSCVIKQGGDMVSKDREKNTLSHFAVDIGMGDRVLHNWCYVKTHVVDNLGPVEQIRWSSANRAFMSLGHGKKPAEYVKQYRRFEKDDGVARKMVRYLSELKGFRNLLKEKGPGSLTRSERTEACKTLNEIYDLVKL